MAGRLVVSTLNNDTGVLNVQNGMTGIAKAWVNFAGASGTRNGSFNVSSVTRNSTGNYTITFTTAMPNTNYAITACCDFQLGTNNVGVIGGNSNGTNGTKTTSAYSVAAFNASFSLYDVGSVYVAVFSS
jgi:hypothetical protein